MGISIHYQGSLKDRALIDQLQEEMTDICKSMEWEYQIWNEDQSQPFSASLEHTEKGAHIHGHIPLRGISIHTDPENESLDLLFTPQGQLSSFMLEIMKHDGTLANDFGWVSVKTQYGSANAHIAIIKLLRYLQKKFIPDLEVKDEAEYWETADKHRLLELRGFLFRKMAELEDALSSMDFEEGLNAEEVADKIEEVLKKMEHKSK